MRPEDQKRLDREADIAKAKRGPDYSRLEAEIAGNKSEYTKKTEAQAEVDERVQRGVRMTKGYYKALERMASAELPVDKSVPEGQERGR